MHRAKRSSSFALSQLINGPKSKKSLAVPSVLFGIAASFLASAQSASAQTTALTGKVTDASGKTIGGAVVSLKSKQLKDTSDAAGMYSLSGATSSQKREMLFPGKGSATLVNGTVGVELTRPERVRVDFLDVRGNRLNMVVEKSLSAGSHRFDAETQASGAGMAIVRVSIGDQSERFLHFPMRKAIGGAGAQSTHSGRTASDGALAKSQAIEDALETTAVGFKAKSTPITAYEGNVDITLESDFTGTCAESKSLNSNAKGNGPHTVVVETNADNGIKEGTIFRPSDLGPGKQYPIVVWGQGACSKNGLDAAASMAQIASHGYFVIADGTPNGTGSRTMNGDGQGSPHDHLGHYQQRILFQQPDPVERGAYAGAFHRGEPGCYGSLHQRPPGLQRHRPSR